MRVPLALTLLMLASCASLKKTEYFAEYGAGGFARYYRVSVDGWASGKLDYRSGWYSGKAVDDLFGSVADEHNAEVATAQRKKRAIEKTFDRYMEALEKGTAEEATERRQTYEAALKTATGVTNAGEAPVSTLDRAGEKFVMVMANDPSKILDAISQRVQTQTISESVGLILKQNATKDQAALRARLAALRLQLEQLDGAIESAVGKVEKAQDGTELRRNLTSLRTELEALR